jgi:superfamily II RNA helicase
MRDWMEGKSFNSIIEKFGLFEGNFIKDLLKISNIAAELQMAAEIAENYSVAMNAKKVYEAIQRDVIKPVSLYIHLDSPSP